MEFFSEETPLSLELFLFMKGKEGASFRGEVIFLHETEQEKGVFRGEKRRRAAFLSYSFLRK